MGSRKFNWTLVYAKNFSLEHANLWNMISKLGTNNSQPWLLQGDLNVVYSKTDRCRGDEVSQEMIDEVRNYFIDVELMEMNRKGCPYTWTNNQEEDHEIWRRLDYAFTNTIQRDQIWCLDYKAMPSGVSDHAPILINCDIEIQLSPKSFRFFNLWCKHEAFKPTVSNHWRINVQRSKIILANVLIEYPKAGIEIIQL